jgi:hypothetical protein
MMDEESKIIEDLILQGALEVAGIDLDTGEPLYNFTNKLQSINPELHNEFSKYFSSETIALWEYGFLDMDITDINPVVRVTKKAFDPESVAKLNKGHQYTLKEIIRVLLEK